jgi:tetratricopeptide (TPR) repeat protein
MDAVASLGEADRLIEAGDAHFGQEEFAEAEPLFRQAIDLRLAVLGEDDERVAVALNRLANVHYQRNEDAEAYVLFARALAIREKVLPPDHPDLRLSVNNLANCCRNLRRCDEAEPLYRRSLALLQRQTGRDHHLPVFKNLALVLEGQGRMDEAEALRRLTDADAPNV